MNRDFEEQVYYVESDQDESVLVAVGLKIQRSFRDGENVVGSVGGGVGGGVGDHENGYKHENGNLGDGGVYFLEWFDTVYWRRMTASEVWSKNGELFFKRIETEGGGMYHFTPMTVATYNQFVRDELFEPKDFTDDEEVRLAFLRMIKRV